MEELMDFGKGVKKLGDGKKQKEQEPPAKGIAEVCPDGDMHMFSRVGKETQIKELVFVGEPKGTKGIESTFEKDRKKEAMHKKRGSGEEGGGDDDENF